MSDDDALNRPPSIPHRDFVLLALLGSVFLISLLSMPAVRYDGDAITWEMEAESLVYRGTLAVRTSVAESLPRNAPYFVFNPETGKWYSKYGIANTLLYAIPIAFERFVMGGRPPDPPSEIFGKPAGPFKITRRVELLNGFNLLLTLLLAAVLYRVANRLTPHRACAAAFTLACLYSTYLWHYTRAQSSQIYQVLFFSLMYLFLLRCVEETREMSRPQARTVLWCVLSLVALCGVKPVFLPLAPMLGLAIVLGGWNGQANVWPYALSNVRENLGTYIRSGVVPLLILAFVMLWVNDLKFGSPLNMGYERETNLFSGEFSESVPAYLFSPRFSIFIHFPLLILALFGMPAFLRRHRYEVVTGWAFFFVMFAIYASYRFWTGEATYGARYLVFGLPVLSLPALSLFDAVHRTPRSWATRLLAAGIATLLLVSSAAQVMVNRLEFHAFFRLRQQFQLSDRRDPELWDYLRNTNTAVFNRDFIRFRDEGIAPLPLRRLQRTVSAERYEQLETAVRAHLSGNHYFW